MKTVGASNTSLLITHGIHGNPLLHNRLMDVYETW